MQQKTTTQEGLPSVRVASAKNNPIATETGVEAVLRQALELMRKGQYAQAERVLKHILETHGRSTIPLLNLGITYSRLGRFQEAELNFTQALEEDPANFIAYNELGIVNRKTGRFQQAKDAYQHALRLYPEYALAHLNLGILCDLYLQNLECAIQHYQAFRQYGVDEDYPVDLWIDDLQRRYTGQPAESAEGVGR